MGPLIAVVEVESLSQANRSEASAPLELALETVGDNAECQKDCHKGEGNCREHRRGSQ